MTMWEVRAAEGRLAELLGWLLARVGAGAQVYRSAGAEPGAEPGAESGAESGGARVVVIDPSGQAEQRLAGVPAELVARPAHAWDFEPVRND
ncbi:MAG: hypothetical protein ACR2N4_13100 [Jatrophihabitans sp.]